jgi:hypothetical protein
VLSGSTEVRVSVRLVLYPSRSCGVWNGKLNQNAPTAKKPSPASLLQGVAAEASFGYDEIVMEGSRPRRALPTSQGTPYPSKSNLDKRP